MAKKEDKDLMESGAKVKLGTSDKIIRGFGYVFLTLYSFCCIVPFIIIVSTSFTSESVIRAEGVQLLPKDITLTAYNMVTKSGGIWWSYLVTIILTVVGTAIGLSIIAMTGYALQKGLSVSKCNIVFHLFHESVSGGTGTVLPADDTDLSLEGQLSGSVAAPVDVAVADHTDEEFRQVDTA